MWETTFSRYWHASILVFVWMAVFAASFAFVTWFLERRSHL